MESKKLNLAMNILKYTIGALGLIGCIWVIATSPDSDATEIVKDDYAESSQMTFAIGFTIAVIIAAMAGVLLFFVYQLVTNSKKTIMSIIGIVAAFLVYLVFRMVGTTDTNESLQLAGNYKVSDATLDATTAGLWTVLLGIMIAVVLALLGPFILGKYRK